MATFPVWREELDDNGLETEMIHPFPSEKVCWIICSVLVASSLLALISLLWQHTAAVTAATTAESFAYGFVKSGVGAAAIGLGWAVVGANILALVMIVVMTVGINMLSALTATGDF